ncbi:MAG: enoyl-CoA hydratase/isomerase family protein [bacterium]
MTKFQTSREAIASEIREGVALVTLNRPEAMNAVSPELARGLLETLSQLPDDGSVRAILVAGTGRAFCSGGDIRAMSAALDEDPKAFFLDLTESLHGIALALLRAEVPTIAAVNGVAAGFGFGLALACDLVVASERATFSMAHGQVAQIPDGGGWYLLPRVVGRKRALDLYLTRRVLDAKTAESWGIINEILPVANFREVAFGFAREIAQGPTLAYRHAKHRLDDAWHQPLEEYVANQRRVIAELGGSKDFEEGVRAFLERRAPEFRGE